MDSKRGQRARRRPDLEAFLAERAPLVASLSAAELDDLTRRALAGIDKQQTLREIEALRESWKTAQPVVHRRPQRRRSANG